MQENATPFRKPRVAFIRGPLVSLYRLQQVQQSVAERVVLRKLGPRQTPTACNEVRCWALCSNTDSL